MSITSEKQKRYDPEKGGFSYYTLFHADKGERPSWAQDGDMLEEFGEGGKAYVCSRDAKGRIKWTEKTDWDRQTGGGSSESGGGGGGVPNPLTVTLTESLTPGTYDGDKTYKEVYDAFIAGQTVLFKVTTEEDGDSTGSVLSAGDDGEKYIIRFVFGRSIITTEGASGNIEFIDD